MSRRSVTVLALALATVVLVGLGAFALGRDHASAAPGSWRIGPAMMGRTYGYGPGMMGAYRQVAGSGACSYPYGPGMMGGSGGSGPGMMGGVYDRGSRQSSVTKARLEAVRELVERQLPDWGCSGFRVGEIMAFSRNDYVLVRDRSGRPAFELLADPKGDWLVPEPGPNMMWNTSYGPMGGYFERGASGTPLTATQAQKRADAWLRARYPGRVAADATPLPGYFTIDVTARGRKVGMLSVNARTGAVWYHSWHGRFLADVDF